MLESEVGACGDCDLLYIVCQLPNRRIPMTESLSETERALLAPYLTNLDQPVFALRNLPEEVIAVLFAYYSRSRDSLRQNLLKLIVDRDLDFSPGATADDASDRLANARE